MFARPCFTGKFSVHPSHDFHQRRFTRAVRANDPNLRIRVELQIDIAKNGLACAGEGFCHSLHYEAILGCHGDQFLCCITLIWPLP